MTATNEQDCRDLGRSYWHLQDAVDRASFATANRRERALTTSLADAANRYVAAVNPMEVSEQAKLLQQLNTELEKAKITPGTAFMAGTVYTELTPWMLHHCPTELVWGLPVKAYATALTACSALEPDLRRFERNVMRLMSSGLPDRTGSK